MKRKLTGFLAMTFAFSMATPILRGDDNPERAKSAVSETKKTAKKSNKKTDAKAVEMFQAMEEGILTVDFIGKDAKEANLIFKNKGNEAINVVLPETFGAVPVLAQGMMGGGGMGGMGGGGMGGMGGGGMGGMGGGGMMGGMMRVEPDTPRKMTVATLCLNHGKADPNPRMKYKVVRLAEVNDSPVIEEFCKALAAGKVSQNTAQAAAWHVANGLTWEELVRKPRVISEYTGVEMFFSKFEIQAAMRFTSLATQAAEKAESYKKYNVSTSSDSQEESIGDKLSNCRCPVLGERNA
jgi:hypothetical protein